MPVHRREHAEFYLQEAFRMQMQGQLEDAVVTYQKSLSLHALPETHTFLGWTYYFQGKLSEAIDECRKAIAIDPSYGNPHNDIGAYLIEMGRLDEAIPHLRNAINSSRYEARHYPHFNLSRIYIMKGDLAQALHELKETVRLCPDYSPAIQEIARLKEEERRRRKSTAG